MEEKIVEVIRHMTQFLNETQQNELKSVLTIVFSGCEIVDERKELRVINESWRDDLNAYLASKELEGKSYNTIKRYHYELVRLLSYLNQAVNDITASSISEYLRMYKYIRKVSNQTLCNVRAVYSSFFCWLRDRGKIAKNPMSMVEHVKVEKRVKTPFSDQERALLRRHCTCLRDVALMEFLYSTAVRVSELVSLNREDIRFTTKDLVVFGKGAKERIVYLNETANMYLKEYLESRTDNNPALFVGLKAPHKRLSKNGVEYIIRKTGKLAGVENAHPHRFRRTSITNAINRGMPFQEAMLMAGHEKADTTKLYCVTDQESLRIHHKKYLCA